MQELFRDVEKEMKQSTEHFREELKRLRTGRASLAMLDGVTVDYYGTPTPLNQVANLSVADASLIVVQPWDTSQIDEIEKGIMSADLGLNPSNDGTIVRVPIPQPTEERRKELVKHAHGLAESARNSVRQSRREGNEALKKRQREGEISEDDEHRGHEEVQRLHDHYVGEINASLKQKEEDILTV